MIISHDHKFIFLKTRKTASTSIDMALSKYCGPGDVITYMNKADEALKRELGHKPAQNFMIPPRWWTGRDAIRFVLQRRRPRYTEHMTASSLKRRIDRSIWRGYFKFCVERNPFDKAVSLYYWRTRTEKPKPSLVEFLRGIEESSLSNAHIYSDNGRLVVDHIVRYERLDEELESVRSTLGIGPLDLPRAKGGFRKRGTDYRQLVTGEARSIVERVCWREMKILGYEY